MMIFAQLHHDDEISSPQVSDKDTHEKLKNILLLHKVTRKITRVHDHHQRVAHSRAPEKSKHEKKN
jgi:hypothetical protein